MDLLKNVKDLASGVAHKVEDAAVAAGQRGGRQSGRPGRNIERRHR